MGLNEDISNCEEWDSQLQTPCVIFFFLDAVLNRKSPLEAEEGPSPKDAGK